jgi:hypothetical protein
MLNSCANVNSFATVDQRVQPNHVEIDLNPEVAAACPTHILALNPTHSFPVTFHTVHSLMLYSYCFNPPPLSAHCSSKPANPGTVNVPVVYISLPSAETFPTLQSYIYTNCPKSLLSSLLPIVPTRTVPNHDMNDIINGHAKILGTRYDIPTLLHYAMMIKGPWQNACFRVLAIFDEPL